MHRMYYHNRRNTAEILDIMVCNTSQRRQRKRRMERMVVVEFQLPVLSHQETSNLRETVAGSSSKDQPRDAGAVKVCWMPPPRRQGERLQPAGDQGARISLPRLGRGLAAPVESRTVVYSLLEMRRKKTIDIPFSVLSTPCTFICTQQFFSFHIISGTIRSTVWFMISHIVMSIGGQEGVYKGKYCLVQTHCYGSGSNKNFTSMNINPSVQWLDLSIVGHVLSLISTSINGKLCR